MMVNVGTTVVLSKSDSFDLEYQVGTLCEQQQSLG